MFRKFLLSAAILTSPAAWAQDSFPTTIEHITIQGEAAKDIVGILTDSGAEASADALTLNVRRLLCINVVVDSGDAFFECAFRPKDDAASPAPSEPNQSSELISSVAYNGCMLSPAIMPLVCDIGFDTRDLPVVADRAERLFTILSEYAPIIPPFAPYLLFGVEHLKCKAPRDTKEYACTMEAQEVSPPN